MYNLLYSLISLTIALFFLTMGVLCVMLPWSPTVRADLVRFILEDSVTISLFGAGFVLVGLAVIINIAFNARHSYYRIRSGPKAISIDESIIQDYLNTYLNNLFPGANVPNRLTIKKNKLYLAADLPFVPIKEQKQLLEKIKNELSDLFSSTLGYRDAFYISASFQSEDRRL